MKKMEIRSSDRPLSLFFKRLIIVCLGINFLYGCAQIRQATYPRDYVYLEKKEIRSNMALLGLYVRKIEETLISAESVSSKDQNRILELLLSINETTEDFLIGNRDTNHLIIDDHLGQFRSDVYSSIRGVKATPPNYFFAGKISGSCVACHKFR